MSKGIKLSLPEELFFFLQPKIKYLDNYGVAIGYKIDTSLLLWNNFWPWIKEKGKKGKCVLYHKCHRFQS